ncbi:trna ligase [Coemansia sp. Benny D115]|nr:trna ligase [Coemansia sp. Benny D115]
MTTGAAFHSATRHILGPLSDQERYDIRQLVTKMRELSAATPASKQVIRQTAHEYKEQPLISWKCGEFLYKKNPCPLPTQARGLFTSGESDDQVIVARGYNKFFNVDEVPTTKWSWIEANTMGPYELTVKENGCLIMAASINDGRELLVTSKHAVNVPHAEVGSAWVDRHLATVGKTREELAAFLHENNATAVFELCDDEFEEHILEYPERSRGLYLHGLNRNTVELETWPSTEVAQVAEDFGFHKTGYYVFHTPQEGKQFADRIREEKMLDGRAIEGFVVRCRRDGGSRPFMFKIKYDEPYLMFREWREITGRVLADKPFKTRYELSKVYVSWLKTQIKADPASFENFATKGVIGTRKRFLEYYANLDGAAPIQISESVGSEKLVLMPVATIGCGKSTISRALATLLGFEHVQNDELNKKRGKGADVFNNAVLKRLGQHDLVIADRNNHLKMLRESLTTAVREKYPGARIIALYWSHAKVPEKMILEKTIARVSERGEAHLKLTPKKAPKYRSIMYNFIKDFAPVDTESKADSLVDEVIELDPMADSAQNLALVLDALCSLDPVRFQRPSDSDIQAALDESLAFNPVEPEAPVKSGAAVAAQAGVPKEPVLTTTAGEGKDKGKGTKKADTRKQMPAYFGLVPTHKKLDIMGWLKRQMTVCSDVDWSVCQRLLEANTHNGRHHITLAHAASMRDQSRKAIFNGYLSLFENGESDKGDTVLSAACEVDYLVCNGRVMALRVASMKVNGDMVGKLPETVLQQPREAGLLKAANLVPHITLATDEATKPVMANDMLREVFGPDNAEHPINRPCGWTVIPVTMAFNAALHSFKY